MYAVFVSNNIDFGERIWTDDPMIAVLWAIWALNGPCRSGNAEFFRVESNDSVTYLGRS